MPEENLPYVACRKIRGKHRLVVSGTFTIARNENGTARDGGGHANAAPVIRQAGYVNQGIEKKYAKKSPTA